MVEYNCYTLVPLLSRSLPFLRNLLILKRWRLSGHIPQERCERGWSYLQPSWRPHQKRGGLCFGETRTQVWVSMSSVMRNKDKRSQEAYQTLKEFNRAHLNCCWVIVKCLSLSCWLIVSSHSLSNTLSFCLGVLNISFPRSQHLSFDRSHLSGLINQNGNVPTWPKEFLLFKVSNAVKCDYLLSHSSKFTL